MINGVFGVTTAGAVLVGVSGGNPEISIVGFVASTEVRYGDIFRDATGDETLTFDIVFTSSWGAGEVLSPELSTTELTARGFL